MDSSKNRIARFNFAKIKNFFLKKDKKQLLD